MQKIFLLILISFSLPSGANPVNISAIIPPSYYSIQPEKSSAKDIRSSKIKDIQKLLGRKLTLKEKIAYIILKKKLRHYRDKVEEGQTAFNIGIVGLALLIIGLFVPYVILGSLVAAIIAIVMGSIAKKKSSSDSKAKAAMLLGWITLGLIAFLFLLVAIVIASWWYWW